MKKRSRKIPDLARQSQGTKIRICSQKQFFDILKLWEAVQPPMGSCSRKVNEE
jgi:hypothetical protein